MSQLSKPFYLTRFSVFAASFVTLLSLLAALFLGILQTKTATAATSSTLNFQARLMSSSGAIVPDGFYNVEFKIFNASSSSGSSQGSCTGDSNCLWTETRTSGNTVRVANGYLSVNLGSVTTLPAINWDQELWLTMNIGGTSGSPAWDGEMTPRLKLTAVPYAFRAGQLATMNGANTGTLSFVQPTANRSVLIPDASGTICLQNSASCGFLTGAATDYIQNQNSSDQTANFRISGTGRANTALQAPLFDTASAATLNIGTTNATSISLNKATSVTGNLSQSGGTISLAATGTAGLTATGALTLTGGAASTFSTTSGGITIQAFNTNVLTLNTSGAGTVSLGNTNSTTISIGRGSDIARTINIGNAGSSTTQTISIGSTNGGSNTTIQGGTGSSAINLTAGSGGTINMTASGSGTLNLSTGSGGTLIKTTTNSTTALRVLKDDDSVLLNVDSTSGVVRMGAIDVSYSGLTSGTIDTASGGVDLNLGTGNANSITLGRSNAPLTLQGNASSVIKATSGSFTTTIGFTAPTANRSVTFADEGGTVCIRNSSACGFLTGAATDYIQNQNSSDQTANFRINGTGRANTALQAPLFDTATAVALNIGTTNATAINLNKATSVTGNLSQSGGTIALTATGTADLTATGALTLTGGAASTWSTSAGNLTIQAATTNTLNLQTAGAGTVAVGDVNSTTINIGRGSDIARTINIGTAGSSTAQAITMGSTGSTSTTTIQGGTGSTAISLTTGTNGSINLTTAGTGDINLTSTDTIINKASTSFQIQNAAGNSNLLVANTSTTRIAIAQASASYTLDVAGDINSTTSLRVAGTQVCDSAGCVAKSGSGFYIHNQTTVQTANQYIQSASSSSITALFQGAASQSVDILQIQNSSATKLFGIAADGSLASITTTADTSTAWNLKNSTTQNLVNIKSDGTTGLGVAASTTFFGKNTIGGTTDSDDADNLEGTRFTTPASAGATNTAWIYAPGPIDSAPNNKFRVAIYTNSGSNRPQTLVASSAEGTLTTGWNQIPISATLSNSTNYWIVVQTNGTSVSVNNWVYDSSGLSCFSSFPYAAFPSTHPTCGGTPAVSFSFYVTFGTADTAVNISNTGNMGIGTSSPTKMLDVRGDALFRNGTNSTTAFQIQNSSNAALFTADTSGTNIQIGSSTTDATAVLVTLDSYNNATDPSGTNGAMYYNSARGVFRCYESSAWKDCLARHITTLGSDVANSTTSLADATGLSFSATSGTTYRFHAHIIFTAAASGTGSLWSMNAPSTSILGFTCEYPSTNATQVTTYSSTVNTPAGASTGSANTAGNIAQIDGILTASANGTVIVRFASEVAASAITAKAGSTIEWW